MSTEPENQPQVRRPRLVVPGAGESVAPRPKIMLPGLGVMIDPSAPPAPPPPVELVLETPDEVPLPEDANGEEVDEVQEEGEVSVAADETAEVPGEVAEDLELEPEPPPAGEAEAAPVMEEFLGEPYAAPETKAEIHEHVPRLRVPELRASPADLKALVPRKLGPPAAAAAVPESGEDATVADESATEPTGEPVVVAQAWEPTVVEYEGRWETTETAPDAAVEQQAQEQQPEQAYATSEAEAQEEEIPLVLAAPAPEPAPEVVRKTASVRVPMPLTSPQGLARPPTRMVTQRVRGATGHPTQSMGGKTTQRPEQAPRSQSAPKPKAVAPVAPPAVPGWMLALIGFFVGVLVAILLVTKSPMKGKMGLTSRSEAAKYTLQVLAEERAQIQAMLDDYYEKNKITLAAEMQEYRAESGKKAPETMKPGEFGKPAEAEPEAAEPAASDKEEAEPPADEKEPAP